MVNFTAIRRDTYVNYFSAQMELKALAQCPKHRMAVLIHPNEAFIKERVCILAGKICDWALN